MNGRIADDSNRAWNIAVFGADCLKLVGKGQKYRSTRVFLHPTSPNLLCWISRWKSQKDAVICLDQATLGIPEAVAAFTNDSLSNFLSLKSDKRSLVLSFNDKADHAAFVAVIREIIEKQDFPP